MGARPSHGLSRRDLSRGTLSALLLASCGGRPRGASRSIRGGFADDLVEAGHRLRDGTLAPRGSARDRRASVVIVGGGIAGLSAAWRLARAGVEDVVVLELGPEAGGTSRGTRLRGDHGFACPTGAHYLPLPRRDQAAVAAFLEDAGVAEPGASSPDGRVVVPDRMLVRDPAERVAALGGFFQEGLYPGHGASGEDLAQLDRFEALVDDEIRLDAAGLRHFGLPVATSSTVRRDLDGTSAARWAEEQGFTSERLRWYLEYATRDDFGASLQDTSAWALLHYFTARASLGTKESAPYMTWPEGNGRLVQWLTETAGAEVLGREATVAVEPGGTVSSVRTDTGEATRWRADHVICATPQFVTRRLLRGDPAAEARGALRYGPWLVANLRLERPPAQRGFPSAWDSVIVNSRSLGYVDACHQLDRMGERSTVWTWYLPITDSDEGAARRELLARPWESWRDAILADLRQAHPDIDEVVTDIEVWRWGHGMVKPTPGTLWRSGDRQRAAAPVGRVHFAHSDLSGIALFEEAHWQGTRAAEEVLAGLGIATESLL